MNESCLLSTVCATVASLLSTIAIAEIVKLQPRDLDGNTATIEAYYAPNLGITWTAHASISGHGTWDNQVAWTSVVSPAGGCQTRTSTMTVRS